MPSVALFEDEYSEALRQFGRGLPELRGIVVVSSHWMNPGAIQITSALQPKIQKNFYGYQPELYQLEYDPPGSPELAQEIADLLDQKNFEVSLNPESGLDHGVWIPLLRIRPEADVPVIQVALPMFVKPRLVMSMGNALGEMRERGILLIGSGGAAFNPTKMVWSAGTLNVNQKIAEFDRWLRHNFMEAKVEEILNYQEHAPHAEFAHPTPANLLPLMFTMGTSLAGDRPGVLFQGFRYSTQSMLTLSLSEYQHETRINLTH
jgi:4,5-DOPA dioxygenase extradiol